MKTLVLIASMIAFGALMAAPQTTKTGSIAGKVTRTGTSEPLPDVQVTMTGTQGEAQTTKPFTIMTDNNGRFSAPDLLPGQYAIQAQRDGFYAPNSEALGGWRTSVTLAPQQTIKDLAVSLTEGGTISGRVLDPEGQGLASVPLTLRQLDYSPTGRPVWRPVPLQTAAETAQRQANLAAGVRGRGDAGRGAGAPGFTTNDDGEYRLFWLAPGSYYIRADFSPAGRPAGLRRGAAAGPAYTSTYYPNTADAGRASPVEVRSGAELSAVDIRVQKPGVSVSGRMVPIEGSLGVEIFLLPRSPETPIEPFLEQVAVSNNLTPNQFSIPGVHPGSYFLYARTVTGPQGRGPGSVLTALEVGSVDIDGITLALRPNVDVNGKMIVDGVSAPGFPAGFRAQLLSMHGSGPGATVPVAIAQDGKFSAKSVEQGQYYLSPPARGMPAGSYIADIRQGSQSVMNDGIITVEGETAPIEVLLKTSGGSVEGVALNSGGMPAAGVLVLVPQSPRRRNLVLYRQGSSDRSGRFVIDGIAPGDYKLFGWEIPTELNVRNGSLNPEFLSRYEARGLTVTVREGITAGSIALNLISGQRSR